MAERPRFQCPYCLRVEPVCGFDTSSRLTPLPFREGAKDPNISEYAQDYVCCDCQAVRQSPPDLGVAVADRARMRDQMR